MGMAATLVMWPSIWNLALIGPAVLEKKIFENGGRTEDNGACPYYKLTNELKGSGELKKIAIFPSDTHTQWIFTTLCMVQNWRWHNAIRMHTKAESNIPTIFKVGGLMKVFDSTMEIYLFSSFFEFSYRLTLYTHTLHSSTSTLL